MLHTHLVACFLRWLRTVCAAANGAFQFVNEHHCRLHPGKNCDQLIELLSLVVRIFYFCIKAHNKNFGGKKGFRKDTVMDCNHHVFTVSPLNYYTAAGIIANLVEELDQWTGQV